jgi:hypothetical protein
MNARRAPQRIVAAEPANELTGFGRNSGDDQVGPRATSRASGNLCDAKRSPFPA